VEAFWATLTWLLLGLPVAAVLLRHGRVGPALGVLPFAGGLALELPVMAAPWLGGSLEGWGWKAPLAALLLAGLAHGLLRGSDPRARASDPPGALHRTTLALAGLSLLGWAAYSLHVGSSLSQGPPSFHWDAYQIWLLRAKVIARSTVFPVELFTEPQLVRGQWNYPIFLPSYLAWFMRVAPLELRELQLAFGILAALLPLAAFLLLLGRVPPLLAAALALSPLAVPNLFFFHFTGWADPAMIMALVAGAAGTTIGVVRQDRPLAVAGGFALATVVAIKNDGILWFGALAFSLGLVCLLLRRGVGRSAGELFRPLLPGLLFFLAWNLTCRWIGVVNEIPLDGSDAIPRLAVVGTALAEHLREKGTGVAIALCLGAIAWILPGRPAQRLPLLLALLALPLVYLVGLVAIYTLSYLPESLDVDWLLLTSLERVTFGLAPTMLCMAVAATAVRRAASATTPPSAAPPP
jgi:hypothetical protein